MKTRRVVISLLLLGMLVAIATVGATAQVGPDEPETPPAPLGATSPLGTSFSYQGEMRDGGGPVNGACDLRFKLWNAANGGSQVGSTLTLAGVVLVDGLFTAELDFGANAFQGDARWLEVGARCPAGSGSYTWLAPRQPLTASPYALYARQAPWSGLGGVPAGLADGDDDTLATLSCANGQIVEWDGTEWACGDDDVGNGGGGGDITAVEAGTGLKGGGDSGPVTLYADTGYLQRRVTGECAAGSSIRVVKADGTVTCEPDDAGGGGAHDHFGQIWTGSNNPLTLNGSFSLPDAAPLILANSHGQGDGLRVSEAGDDGLQVDDVGGDGLFVDLAGDDGVNVFKAGNPSGHSASTEHNGFEVAGAEGHGLHVGRAYGDGVHVYKAGDPSDTAASLRSNGVEIEGAVGHGLYVGRSGFMGVYVYHADRDGVLVEQAGSAGPVAIFSPPSDGFEVQKAEGSGLFVGKVGDHGVVVADAALDGVVVHRAGNPAETHEDSDGNGFEVRGAERDGVYVGYAGDDGLHVYKAADQGVRVFAAGNTGVYANTSQGDHEWGLYTPDKIYAGTSMASGGPSMIVAQNGDPSALETGDVVAVSGIGPGLAGSEFPVPQVRRASASANAVAGVVYRRFSVEGETREAEGNGQGEEEASAEAYSAEGPIAPGDYLLIVVLGPAQVKVENSGGGIQPGDLLAVAAEGRTTRAAAAALAPGAIVGQAMESLDGAQGSGLAWVLVMPR